MTRRTIQKSTKDDSSNERQTPAPMSFRDYVEENGNGGREVRVGGRVTLAHEDPTGYAESVLDFLEGQQATAPTALSGGGIW